MRLPTSGGRHHAHRGHDGNDCRRLGLAAGAACAAPPRAPPHPDEVRGQYDLADGRVLTVSDQGGRLYGQLGDRPEVRFVAVGGAVFEAADGTYALTFKQYGNGSVAGVTVSKPALSTADERPMPR